MDRLNNQANFLAKEMNKLNDNLDISNRNILYAKYNQERNVILRDLLRNLQAYMALCKNVIDLGRQFSDLNIDAQSYQDAINSAQTNCRWIQSELKR
jgi:hypothetical protein